MSNLELYLLTFLLYGALAAYFWRVQLGGKTDSPSYSAAGYAVLLPLVLHGYLLHVSIFDTHGINFSLVQAVSLILWLAVLVYWVAQFFYPIGSLQALVLPLAAVGVLLPGLFPSEHPRTGNASFAFEAHIMAAMMAYSLFTIAALHAMLILWVEKRLHHAALPKALRDLPPLLTMEALLFRVINVGFILLTLTLALGMVFSQQIFGEPLQFKHMILFGILSWVVFAALLAGRHFYGWRGRRAVHWMMSGYVFLVLAYLGTEFVQEVLLHR